MPGIVLSFAPPKIKSPESGGIHGLNYPIGYIINYFLTPARISY
jgi:hypothetical protein